MHDYINNHITNQLRIYCPVDLNSDPFGDLCFFLKFEELNPYTNNINYSKCAAKHKEIFIYQTA
jgi:hypothetical protein